MIEIILAVIILALLGYLVWTTHEWKLERKTLINAILAKTPEQLRDLNLADKVVIQTAPPNAQSDLMPIAEMSEDEFDTHIKEQLENG
jgi:hypothetical protein